MPPKRRQANGTGRSTAKGKRQSIQNGVKRMGEKQANKQTKLMNVPATLDQGLSSTGQTVIVQELQYFFLYSSILLVKTYYMPSFREIHPQV